MTVSIPQQKFREVVFQLLFSNDLANPVPLDMENLLIKELSISRKTVREAQEKVDKIQESLKKINELIITASTSYAFSRIQKVELNILRLGVYELLFDDEIPQKVAIAEAIRLAKKFSTRESASFINAVLDSLMIKDDPSIKENKERLREKFEEMMESEEIAGEAALHMEKKIDENNIEDTEGNIP